jgi:hypothetical protein
MATTAAILESHQISNPFQNAVPPTDPVTKVALSGPSLPPLEEGYEFVGVCTISPQSEGAELPALSYINLNDLPGIKERLSVVSLASIRSVRIVAYPMGGCNVDIHFRIVPAGWASNHTSSRTATSCLRLSHLATIFWRSNITVAPAAEISVPWPTHEAISASLTGGHAGLDEPRLLVALRSAPGDVGIPIQPLVFTVHLETAISGRGYFGYPV